jgi:hypothetical protein
MDSTRSDSSKRNVPLNLLEALLIGLAQIWIVRHDQSRMKAPCWVAIGVSVSIALVAGCASQSQVPKPPAPATISSPSADFLLISAVYGSGTHFADVTHRVNDLLHPRDEWVFFARPDWLHADPTPGWNKALVIVYEFKGERHIFTTGEGGGVSLEQLKLAKEERAPFVKVKLKVVKVDSEETQAENCAGANAVDENPNTIWHTEWQANTPGLPHEIVIELLPPSDIKGFAYLPRQDGSDHGCIKDFEFYVSDDGTNFGEPIKQGAFKPGKGEDIETFKPIKCRFIKLKALSEINGGAWTSAAEIRVIQMGEDASVKTNWRGNTGPKPGPIILFNPNNGTVLDYR